MSMIRLHRWMSLTSILVLVVFLAASLGTPVAGQTGDRWVNPHEVRSLPRWKPRPMGEGVSPTVDLRPWLPPIGEQQLNDCTGWAAGYMAKSYQEAIDQQWKPDAPPRIFSPSFLYNQLNGGKDQGASLLQVAKFMQRHGCATLAAMPYQPRDFLSQPSPLAIAEANRFRIASLELILSGEEIRLALQQRYVVLLAARVGPTFLAGRFDTWTRELHERDWQSKKPDQPHGFHAMAIVGADDRRGAFLVANSWGTGWNQQGYCWVSYDALAELDPREESSHFGMYAIVLEDEPYRLAPDERPETPLDKKSIEIRKVASHAGYDTASQRHRYEFSASLAGQRKAMALLSGVEWRWQGGGKPQTLSSSDAGTGFRVTGVADDANAVVTAVLTFADNTTETRSVKLDCQPPTADNRDVGLEFTTRYAGRDTEGRPMWQWSARPVGRLTDLADIDHVRYDRSKLDPREPQATVSRLHDPQASTAGYAREPGQLEAVVVFRDGGEKRLRGTPVFDAPANDSPQLLVDVRDTGVHHRGRRLFAVATRTLVPVFDGTKIEHVEYDFGPTLGDRTTRNTRFATDFDEPVTATRDFRLLASVKYRDGRVVKLDRWVRLGNDTGYANPRNLAIDVEDEYHGRVGDVRKWRVTLTPVGETELVRNAKRVTYRFANAGSDWRLSVDRQTDSSLRVALMLDNAVDLLAEIELADGTKVDVPFNVQLHGPPEDSPRLLVGGYRHEEFAGLQRVGVARARVGIAMPVSLQQRVDRVEYHLPSPHDRDRVVVSGLSDIGGQFVIDRRIEGTTPLLASVVTRDGWSEWLNAELVPAVRPLERIGPLEARVRVRERWHGIEQGKALHEVQFALDGPDDERARVRRVVVIMPRELFPGDDPTETLEEANQFRASILATRGFDAVARLELVDGTTREQPLRVYCASDTPTDLAARASARWTTLPGGQRELRTVLWLAGPGRMTEQVVAVEWSYRAGGGTERRVEQTVPDAAHGQFAVLAFLDGPQEVRAEVKMRDGKTRSLLVRVAPPAERVEPEVSDVFWGFDEQGKPLWLCTIRPTGLPVLDGRLTFARYFGPDGQQFQSLDFPSFAASWVRNTPTTCDIEFVVGREGTETVKHVRVEPRSAVLENELKLSRDVIDTPDGKLFQTRIVGPEALLRQVREVTYTLQADGQAWRSVRRVRHARTDGFELLRAGNSASPIVADVLLRDGRTLQLSSQP